MKFYFILSVNYTLKHFFPIVMDMEKGEERLMNFKRIEAATKNDHASDEDF